MLHRQTALALLVLSTVLTGCTSAPVQKHEVLSLRGVIDPTTDFVLEGSDGQQVKANVLTVFRVDHKAYALVKEHGREQPPSLMELVADQKQASFQRIKDKNEFKEVLHIVETHPEIYTR